MDCRSGLEVDRRYDTRAWRADLAFGERQPELFDMYLLFGDVRPSD
jgi:hypothetical protein